MKHINYFLVSILFLLFLGCGKDKELSDEEKAKIEVNKAILYGKWKFVSFFKGGVLITTTTNPCFTDNTIEFRQNGSATISQGACIESPSVPQNEDFTWSFKSPTTIDLGGDEVKIATLTDTSLYFTRVYKNNSAPSEDYRWKK
jgi:hypothetical protein